MADKTKIISAHKSIRLLVVDDSLAFRRVLREIFDKTNTVNIIGEATNGVEAIDMTLTLSPDVTIMDMEMPLMDGMSSLQYLMNHKPTATIMLSSLTREGTTRSFDAIKNGAVDFVCKDSFFHSPDLTAFRKNFVHRVIYAAKVSVRPVEPVLASSEGIPPTPERQGDIIFCEECGTRNIVTAELRREQVGLCCRQCGDVLEVNLVNKYRRINFLSVIGCGQGGYAGLLRILPTIPNDISGAILVILYADSTHVDAFTAYLDAVSNLKVVRMVDDLNIEGGTCYLAAAADYLYLKLNGAHYTIKQAKAGSAYNPFDLVMNSVAAIFKNRVAGIILSGSELDGERGINAIKNHDGLSFVVNSTHCLCKAMGENILRKCLVDRIVDEQDVTGCLMELHESTRGATTTT